MVAKSDLSAHAHAAGDRSVTLWRASLTRDHERRLAERVGFEPTCRLPDKTLSRRPRYDHFGTSPVGLVAVERTFYYTAQPVRLKPAATMRSLKAARTTRGDPEKNLE
jgi:hypothetical protein